MKAQDALTICRNIKSDRCSDEEKLEAVKEAWKYVSRNSLTKPKMSSIIAFLLEQIEKRDKI